MSSSEASTPSGVERRWALIGLAVAAALLIVQVLAGSVREVFSDKPSIRELVETCLTERSTTFEPVTDDLIALSAERGALRTTVQGNRVTVALGGSDDDATRVYEAYAAVAPSTVVGTLLEQRRKIVLLWAQPPTEEQRDVMVLCTLDAQE